MVDALCIGYACFDFIYYLDGFPEEDRKIFVRKTVESGGGPAANAAYLLSSWGARAAFAGCVGGDREGKAVMDELRTAGADTSLVLRAQGYRTPFATILVNESGGTRTVLTRHADPPEYHPDWTRLSGPPSIILADGHQPTATRESLERYPGAATVLDAGSLRDATRELVASVDYALCSEAFGAALIGLPRLDTPEEEAEAVRAVQAECTGRAAITLGERGLVYVEDGRARRLGAFPVKAVDTTAAGDVFHGAFVFALLQKKSFRDALFFAQAAAALSTTRRGGRTSIPAPSEVEVFLEAGTGTEGGRHV
ncbi:MAG: hypothetical protein JXD23_10935 [Spirochaetales bacterium]|nr:hypothetical protein [Spirochaetales bacterium]